MPLDNLEFALQLSHLMLWMIFILVLLVILFAVNKLDQLSHGRKETGQPMETTDDYSYAWEKEVKFPIQETQRPGTHPSNALSDFRKQRAMQLEEIKREQEAIYRELLLDQGGAEGEEHCRHRKRQEREVRDENQKSEGNNENTKQAEGAHQQLLAASSQLLDNNSELGKAKEAIRGETSPVAEAPPSAEAPLERNNVPGDVDHPQDSVSLPEATKAQPSPSDEKPSASSSNAAPFSPFANPNKKKKRKSRRKKKAGSKESLAEARSSGDEEAAVADPETSTDESHHSSIEAFSSGLQEPADSRNPVEPTDSQGAAARQSLKKTS